MKREYDGDVMQYYYLHILIEKSRACPPTILDSATVLANNIKTGVFFLQGSTSTNFTLTLI